MFLFEGGNDNNSNEIGCVFDTKLVVYIFGDGGGVGVGAGKADARAWRGWVGAYNRSSPPSPSFFSFFFQGGKTESSIGNDSSCVCNREIGVCVCVRV